jgi:hypothetical protein
MNEIKKIAGGSRADREKAQLLLVNGGGRSAVEASEHMMDEINRRATEVGPVLEGILHIHCEESVRLWN